MQTNMALVLSLGQATYHVKYTLKKVEATSVEVNFPKRGSDSGKCKD